MSAYNPPTSVDGFVFNTNNFDIELNNKVEFLSQSIIDLKSRLQDLEIDRINKKIIISNYELELKKITLKESS